MELSIQNSEKIPLGAEIILLPEFDPELKKQTQDTFPN